MDQNDDNSRYVYLEFMEKLNWAIFDKKVFLRVANLDQKSPLVQVNDLLFKGSYDECVGTNIFFEEIEDPPPKATIFENDSPIYLKPVITQTKLLRLKSAQLSRNNGVAQKSKESVDLNLKQNYSTVLERLEQGLLNLEGLNSGLALRNDEPECVQTLKEFGYTEPEKELDNYLGRLFDKSANSALEAKYERLKSLARRPVRRMREDEMVEDCGEWNQALDYHNLERLVCQNSDYFRTFSGVIVKGSYVGGVDLDRCVLHGLIAPSKETDRVLTASEERKVFSLNNFDNLSIPARYLVLKECVAQLENLVNTSSVEELVEEDSEGRTLTGVYGIFKRLLQAVAVTLSVDTENVVLLPMPELDDGDYYIKYKYRPEKDILWENYKEVFGMEDNTPDSEESD